jgi:hypothetical protein
MSLNYSNNPIPHIEIADILCTREGETISAFPSNYKNNYKTLTTISRTPLLYLLLKSTLINKFLTTILTNSATTSLTLSMHKVYTSYGQVHPLPV